jgi:Ala-tRNA(Pro) deacylase
MTISPKITNKLNEAKVKHEIVEHKKVFTAYDAAATLKVKLEQVIKPLLVKADKEYHLVLLPAHKNLDFKKLAKILKIHHSKVQLPKEKVMTEKFKVKPGAISAFGSIHKLPVIVEKDILKIKEAIFPTGSFVESLKMKVKDFMEMEKPTIGIFGIVKKIKKAKPVKKIKSNKASKK